MLRAWAILVVFAIGMLIPSSYAEESKAISLQIVGGEVKSYEIDPLLAAVIIELNTFTDGTLNVQLPRSIIDSLKNGSDDVYFVLIDGHESSFDEYETTQTTRSLNIQFSKGVSTVDIIGTWVYAADVGELTDLAFLIIGGTVSSHQIDPDAKSLIVKIDSLITGGSLLVKIPRSMLDAKMQNGGDDNFFVLVDGEETAYEESKSSDSRALTIGFPSAASEIEIIGTSISGEPTIQASKIPEWVRNIFIWYAEDRISEDELLGAIQFLIQQGIIKI